MPSPSSLDLILSSRSCSQLSVDIVCCAKALQAQHNITIDSVGQDILDSSLFLISSCPFCEPFALLFNKTIISTKMAQLNDFNKVSTFRSYDTTLRYSFLSKFWRKTKTAKWPPHSCYQFSIHHPPLLKPNCFSVPCSRRKARHLLLQMSGVQRARQQLQIITLLGEHQISL